MLSFSLAHPLLSLFANDMIKLLEKMERHKRRMLEKIERKKQRHAERFSKRRRNDKAEL